MGFYDMCKEDRKNAVLKMNAILLSELRDNAFQRTTNYFENEDTYIRKNTYVLLGRIFFAHLNLQKKILQLLAEFSNHPNFHVRQTAINSAGEIGKFDFERVSSFFDQGLFDKHHSPRNAVIGSIKKMGEVNPKPVLIWAKKYLHHPDKEIRREICHGIELRGRKHPNDILSLLKELQNDKTVRVRNTLVHVLGQIAYKKGCLPIVIEHLKKWENAELVKKALVEIIDVHKRYKNFAALTQMEAIDYIQKQFDSPNK